VLPVPLDPVAAADAVSACRDAGVTGICAYIDDVALAVLAGLRSLGLAAPDDLAVVGVDDVPAARLAAPPLTTVTGGQSIITEHLARSIVAALAGKRAPATRIGHRAADPPRLRLTPGPPRDLPERAGALHRTKQQVELLGTRWKASPTGFGIWGRTCAECRKRSFSPWPAL
jgi:hypothetical protein